MEKIEDVAIKGLTFKSAAWMAGTLVTIMLTSMSYMSSIKNDISKVATSVSEINIIKAADVKYNELQIRIINQKLDAQEIWLKDLQIKYNTLLENK